MTDKNVLYSMLLEGYRKEQKVISLLILGGHKIRGKVAYVGDEVVTLELRCGGGVISHKTIINDICGIILETQG